MNQDSLDLSNQNLSLEQIKHLSENLMINTTLKELNLSKNSLSVNKIESLSEALKINTTLQSLNLSNNEIDDDKVKVIFESLKINISLQHLDLSDNQIGDIGIKYLSEMLEINTTLQNLNLSNNQIEDEGVKYLSQALEINTTLEKINLSANEIGEYGAIDLYNMLTMNTTLLELNLSGNNIDEYVMESLLDHDLDDEEIEIIKDNLDRNILINGINRELYVNQHPNRYINDINLKYIKKIKKYKIDWNQQRSIHRQYPLNFRESYRAITPLISLEQPQTPNLQPENILPRIPREIWTTQIIPYLAQSYIYDVNT